MPDRYDAHAGLSRRPLYRAGDAHREGTAAAMRPDAILVDASFPAAVLTDAWRVRRARIIRMTREMRATC